MLQPLSHNLTALNGKMIREWWILNDVEGAFVAYFDTFATSIFSVTYLIVKSYGHLEVALHVFVI